MRSPINTNNSLFQGASEPNGNGGRKWKTVELGAEVGNQQQHQQSKYERRQGAKRWAEDLDKDAWQNMEIVSTKGWSAADMDDAVQAVLSTFGARVDKLQDDKQTGKLNEGQLRNYLYQEFNETIREASAGLASLCPYL